MPESYADLIHHIVFSTASLARFTGSWDGSSAIPDFRPPGADFTLGCDS